MKQVYSRLVASTFALVAAVVLVCAVAGQAYADDEGSAPADDRRTIRVAWPDQTGLTETDEHDAYSGYTYEYLERIAQFTDWKYEFVRVEGDLNEQLVTLLGMLESGEVDIMGAMNYSDAYAQRYDFAIKSYGTAHTALLASDANEDLTDVNVYARETLRVAFVGSSPKSTQTAQTFCDMNGIGFERVECEDSNEQVEAVLSGRADALVGSDIGPVEGMHVVATLGANPFYFAVAKGEQDVVSSLNEAITQIEKSEPSLSIELYDKYFSGARGSQTLSKDLQAFVGRSEPVRVGYLAGAAPIQDIDESTGEPVGASKATLEFIASYTGLEIECVPIPNPDNWNDAVEQYDLDAIAGIIHDFDFARQYGLSLSTPYLSSYQCLVVRESSDASNLDDQRLAVSRGAAGSMSIKEGTLICETLEDCIEAVSSGDADYTYAEGFTTSYLINAKGLRNVTSLVNADIPSDFCFAIAPDCDSALLRAFNEAIREMPAGTVNDAIYGEILQDREMTLSRFVEANAKTIIACGVLFTLLIVVLTVAYARNRSKALAIIRAEKERLKAVAEQDDLTGLLTVGALREAAADLAARKEIGGFAVIDIDDFKNVNDTYGHKAGDEALCLLARALEASFRESDAVSRFGGDEFAVCLGGPISKEALETRCAELGERVRLESLAQGRPFTVSIGAHRATEGDESYLDLYDCADKAMYEAKRLGKGRFVIA